MRCGIACFLSLAVGAYAQVVNDTYIKNLIDGLNTANFTAFSGAILAVSSTPEGTALLAALPSPSETGNKWLFAPTNEALAAVPEDVSRDSALMARILSYHVLAADIPPSLIPSSPDHAIMPTYYFSGMLPLNKSQVVVFSRVNGPDGKERIGIEHQNGGTAYAAAEAVDVGDLKVFAVDTVLASPGNVADVVKTQTPALSNVMEQAGLLDALTAAKGITLFAPEDAAWREAASSLSRLYTAQLHTIQANQLINGTVVNTVVGFPSTYISAAGQDLELTRNETGDYVSSGGSTAKIVRADVALANGIMHVIDRVLLNTESATPATTPTTAGGGAAGSPTGGAVGSASARDDPGETGKVSSALQGPFVCVGMGSWVLAALLGVGGGLVHL